MSVIGSNILAGASGQGGGYNLTNSLRFRKSASAYLNRTPASAGNRRTFTWSAWVKRGALSGNGTLFYVGPYTSSAFASFRIRFQSDALAVWNYSSGYNLQAVSTSVYRDPSAWYHIVVAVDTTSATSTITGSSTDRVRLYVNGVQLNSFSATTVPAQNLDTQINTTNAHLIANDGDNYYFDGYLTEVNFIDGQALTPSSFGETNSKTGVWQPKKYTGTYGTNGFYLPFTDVALTSGSNAGLGKDFSGNGNYWNTNNISITSGATYDSMTDVPTLTSATASNFAVLSPIDIGSGSSTNSGNLNYSSASSSGNIQQSQMRATFSVNSGKWYWEVTRASITSGESLVGVVQETQSMASSAFSSGTLRAYVSNGNKENGTSSAYGASWTNNDVIGVALDMDAGTITFYKNNTSQGTAFTGLTGGYMPYIVNNSSGTTSTGNFNFGQRPFAYTPPTGYVALNTFNLPTPTIGATASSQANKYFDILLYTGNGGTQTITGLNFQPDLVWGKARNDAVSHNLFDIVRGGDRQLVSNSTNAEVDRAGDAVVFNSNGITLDASYCNINNTSTTTVAWCWDANGTGVTNTAGSITSTVSANTTSGFSIVTYTGQEPTAGTIGHGLGVAPSLIITKNRSGTGNWGVYHKFMDASSPQSYYMQLNSTSARINATDVWNNTAPTSTVFSVGNAGTTNTNGASYVAYCFSEVAGFSKFGSYTGANNTGASTPNADGNFIYCGFRPRFVLIKRTSSAAQWVIYDSARGTYNPILPWLYPNSSDAETSTEAIDFLSNGFKIRSESGATMYPNGATFIYMAFAENPFKYSLAR